MTAAAFLCAYAPDLRRVGPGGSAGGRAGSAAHRRASSDRRCAVRSDVERRQRRSARDGRSGYCAVVAVRGARRRDRRREWRHEPDFERRQRLRSRRRFRLSRRCAGSRYWRRREPGGASDPGGGSPANGGGGTTGGAETGGTSTGGVPIAPELIEDCENGNNQILVNEGRNGYWSTLGRRPAIRRRRACRTARWQRSS